ncbi:MAG: hypothetical protein M0Z95_05665 [Actinomycetota bacterium]|nr:hypothetical protein [Actinomycetota bacterium]
MHTSSGQTNLARHRDQDATARDLTPGNCVFTVPAERAKPIATWSTSSA